MTYNEHMRNEKNFVKIIIFVKNRRSEKEKNCYIN